MTKNKSTIIPTIIIYKSLRYLHAQIVNPKNGKVLAQFSDKKMSEKTKTLRAEKLGIKLAEILKKQNIKNLTFSRNSNKYRGRIKALIESLRSEGVKI